MQGWLCGRVEGGTLRSGCRCEGHQDVLKPGITEDDQRGLLTVLTWTYSVLTMMQYIEVLQGSGDMEIPSAPEYPATCRCNDVRERVRDGIRLDDKWGY